MNRILEKLFAFFGYAPAASKHLCTRCRGELILGDYFRHERAGFVMSCTAINRKIIGNKAVTTVELSEIEQ